MKLRIYSCLFHLHASPSPWTKALTFSGGRFSSADSGTSSTAPWKRKGIPRMDLLIWKSAKIYPNISVSLAPIAGEFFRDAYVQRPINSRLWRSLSRLHSLVSWHDAPTVSRRHVFCWKWTRILKGLKEQKQTSSEVLRPCMAVFVVSCCWCWSAIRSRLKSQLAATAELPLLLVLCKLTIARMDIHLRDSSSKYQTLAFSYPSKLYIMDDHVAVTFWILHWDKYRLFIQRKRERWIHFSNYFVLESSLSLVIFEETKPSKKNNKATHYLHQTISNLPSQWQL